MKQLMKIAGFISVMLLSFLVLSDAPKVSAQTTKKITINTDGFEKSVTVVINNNRVYVPIRYVSDTFGYTLNGMKYGYPEIIFNQKSQLISVKYDYFRESSKFIINLKDADGKNYISKIDLEKGETSSRVGTYRPIVYNNTTYVSIVDLMEAFGGKVAYENNKLYVLYKGRVDVNDNNYYNSAAYNGLVIKKATELAKIENHYDNLSNIFKLAAKAPTPAKRAFKSLRLGSKKASKDFLEEFDMLVEPYYNDQYLTGMYIKRDWFENIISVRPQTIDDLKK